MRLALIRGLREQEFDLYYHFLPVLAKRNGQESYGETARILVLVAIQVYTYSRYPPRC